MLRASGFEPLTYSSSEAFLDDDKRPQLDCIVLDIELTGMSGLECCRRITALGDQAPVIFFTANDDSEVRRAVIFNVGASSHYLVTTRNTCSALRGAATIGFSATFTNVTTKDRLVVTGNDGLTDTCLIDQIVQLQRRTEPEEP